jgi:hypothetical protein
MSFGHVDQVLRETHAGVEARIEPWSTGDHGRAYELTRLPGGEVLARGQTFQREH